MTSMEWVALNDAMRYGALAYTEKVLRQGGVVVVPTDTVYGIVADATNPDAVEKVFALKGRSSEKALPIFVKDVTMVRRYAYVSDAKARFIEKVWPGAVTVIFHHKEKLPAVLTGGGATIGIRIPSHPFLQDLLARFDTPLAQTSANPAGQPPAQNRADLEQYFEPAASQPDLIVDAGEIAGQASTVIDFTGTDPILRRSGLLSKAELDTLLYPGPRM